MRARVFVIVLIVALFGGAADAKEKLPVWESASQIYSSALSRFRAKQWTEALGLLDQFVKKYSSSDKIPVAYLQLGYCKYQLKDAPGGDKALDVVIKRFPQSPTWFIAYAYKLHRAHQAKKHDEYLALVGKMLKGTRGVVPVRLQASIPAYRGEVWYRDHSRYAPWQSRGIFRRFWIDRGYKWPGWSGQLAEVCDTPARAKTAIKLLSKMLKTHKDDMTPEWQCAHVMLLRQSGEDAGADKAFAKYLAHWGNDPAGGGLVMMLAMAAQKRGDEARATKLFHRIITDWAKNEDLSGGMMMRLDYFYSKKNYKAYSELAPLCIEAYPSVEFRGRVIYLWTRLAMAAVRDNPAVAGEMLKILDRPVYKKDEYWHRGMLQWKYDIHMAAKQYDQAGKAAELLLSEKYWSGDLRPFRNGIRYSPGVAAAVAAAKKRHGIADIDKAAAGAKLLASLITRIADEQVRHMEEIGDEIFTKHRKDPAAIEAVRLLVDYYYKMVLVEKRDKWVSRMLSAWPRHPSTRAVFGQHITALMGAKQYAKAGAAIDLGRSRFPGAGRGWYNRQRLECFDATKDFAAKAAYIRKIYAEQAEQGDPFVLEQIGLALEQRFKRENLKSRGDSWMKLANSVKGTYGQAYCLHQAWTSYAWASKYRWHSFRKFACWDDSRAAGKALGRQTADQTMAWRAMFSSAELYANEGYGGKALAAMNEALSGVTRLPDLHRHLNLATLGRSIGEAKRGKEGVKLAARLRKICPSQRDQDGIDLMQAEMFAAAKVWVPATKLYLKYVGNAPFPAMRHGALMQAADCAASVDRKQYANVLNRYMKTLSRAQDIVPGLLYRIGRRYIGNRNTAGALASVRKLLSRKYAASDARGRLEKEIRARAVRQRQQELDKRKK